MFVGIDVAKDELVVGVRPSGEVFTVGNSAAGVRALVKRWRDAPPTLIVLEATAAMKRWPRARWRRRGSPWW